MSSPSIGLVITLTSVTLLISNLANCSYSLCPSVCSCKWKNGKETVECVDRELTSLPSGIKSGAQVIDLSRNDLRTLPSRMFYENELINLQKIYLSECRLTDIAGDAFYQVTNLVELDLKKNLLMDVPAETFKHCPQLRRLTLGENPIKRLENGTFFHLPQLRFLELSECEIVTIEQEAFKELNNLETLKIDGNYIKTLSQEIVRPLRGIYELHLNNNPWYCDCHLRDIRKWITRKNIPFIIPPKCESPPHVSGKTWDVLEPDDFSCAPSVVSVVSVNVQRYQNGTMACEVESKPEAEVTWIFNEMNLNNASDEEEKYWTEDEYRGNIMVSTLMVLRATEEDEGVYTCVASNPAGNTSRNITFSVTFQQPLSVGWSKAQIAGIIVGVMVFLVLLIVLICIVIVRKRVLATSESKLGGASFLKHLAYAKQNSVEVKSDKEVTISDKNTRRETGSSGYGSDQHTPDLVSRAMDIDPPYTSAPKPLSGLDNSSWNQVQQPNQEWFKERAGHFMSASPSYVPRYINEGAYSDRVNTGDTDSFRDESYHSYTSPVHTNWKRSPLVLPNNAYLSLSHDTCCSPDEGYDEGALEGTEV